MNSLSRRISQEQWSSLEGLLDRWFALNCSRDMLLPFSSSIDHPTIAQKAATLFKRGARGVVDTQTGEEYFFRQNENLEIPSHVDVFPKWSKFFESIIIPRINSERVAIILDQNVSGFHPGILDDALKLNISVYRLNCSEESKSLKTAIDLYYQLDEKIEHIFIVGGGICCDIAAFVGSLLNLKISLIPTTLLALVDAGLGGKTGVNHHIAGKNQIGLFADIEAIFCVQEFLTTLPRALILDGVAEILKHAWLSGKYQEWKPAISALISPSLESVLIERRTLDLILENLNFKKRIVIADPREAHLRVMLNLGHTLAHLLETLNLNLELRAENQPHLHLSHGIAVSYGLWLLIKFNLLKNPPSGFVEDLKTILNSTGLDFPLFDLEGQRSIAIDILSQDKKNKPGIHNSKNPMVRCVLPSYGALSCLPRDSNISEFIDTNTQYISCHDLVAQLFSIGLLK